MGAPQPCPRAPGDTPGTPRRPAWHWGCLGFKQKADVAAAQSTKGFSRRLSRGSPRRSFPEAVWGLMPRTRKRTGCSRGAWATASPGGRADSPLFLRRMRLICCCGHGLTGSVSAASSKEPAASLTGRPCSWGASRACLDPRFQLRYLTGAASGAVASARPGGAPRTGEQGPSPPAAAAVTGRAGGQCWHTPALSGAGWGAPHRGYMRSCTCDHSQQVWRECRRSATAGISNSDNKPCHYENRLMR